MERKLASVRRILELQPIDGADRIEVAIVDGWKVVVKKGEFAQGQLACYFEIDSFVPTEIAPFLTSSGKEPREFEGTKGERLRTVKLRKQLSQGLLLPIKLEHGMDYNGFTVGNVFVTGDATEGQDLTESLGIKKWEKPMTAQLAGMARGNFPALILKTDQERIQNLRKEFQGEFRMLDWEITEKLHGSSCTFYLDGEGLFRVCSRNLDLKFDENNTFWKVALKYNVENNMRNQGMLGYAVQGELIGEGVNGNQYGITGQDFYVFDIQIENKGFVSGMSRKFLSGLLGIKHVPVLETFANIEERFTTIDDILKFAEGKSEINGSEREGLVFKCETNANISFKCVSDKWLISGGEDQ